MRYAVLATTLTALILASSGCITGTRQIGRQIEAAVPALSKRLECRQAERQGWCSPRCKRQPAWCGKVTLVSCSAGLCWWQAGDGSTIVTYHGPRH